MGHVYRSVAYARELVRELPGHAIRFFMRGFPEGVEKVRAEGYAVTELPTQPGPADFGAAFAAHPPELLIIDTLGSTAELIEAARRSAHTVVTIDDLEPSAAEADVIVNGILWGTRLLPEPFGKAQVYQGVEYIQLREQFAEAHSKARVISPKVNHVLISTGGADDRQFALQLMHAMRRVSFDCDVSVMVGPAFHNREELEQTARELSGSVRFAVHYNVPNMAEYLNAADLALITGGTVMFEAAACGTPAVITCSYEHQVPQAEWFASSGAALNLGFFPHQVDQEQTARAIDDLARDVAARERMSAAGKTTVDGEGLKRFVEIIKSRMSAASSAL